jgi:hypothetical protein
MRKEDALANIEAVEDTAKKLKTEIQQVKGENVYREPTKIAVRELCNKWFEEIDPVLPRFGVSDETKKKYHDRFSSLLELAIKPSRKATYVKILSQIITTLRDDLILTVSKSAGQIVSTAHLAKILENATEDEKDYLNEALGCAGSAFFRASVVLGWCAAVHRMHKTVERLGFDEFNKKSEEMNKIADGRFKRFKKSFNVHSLSELRATVFDSDLLWAPEYWGLIDANQHDRLSICFTMRNNSGHPGEAPITEDNLASFYSDLKSFVFDNPKFKL